MGIIIDICLVAILALSIFLGYKRGLVGLAFKILSFLIAIVISLLLYYPISNYVINNTQIDDKIEQTIVSKFIKEENNEENGKKESNNIITKQIEEAAEEVTENTVNAVSKNISRTIINFGVIIVIYIITRLVLLIFKSISDKLADLPIIKQFNDIGGIIYGIIAGFLIIYILFAIFTLTSSLYNSEELISLINSSLIGRIIYNNNIILKLFFN